MTSTQTAVIILSGIGGLSLFAIAVTAIIGSLRPIVSNKMRNATIILTIIGIINAFVIYYTKDPIYSLTWILDLIILLILYIKLWFILRKSPERKDRVLAGFLLGFVILRIGIMTIVTIIK